MNRAIKKSNCFHKYGHEADCNISNYPFMVIFGVTQILLSQIPNFHELSWLSILAAVMSFGYASIGVGLSIAKIAGKYLLNIKLRTYCTKNMLMGYIFRSVIGSIWIDF
jgi:hypothetical protein